MSRLVHWNLHCSNHKVAHAHTHYLFSKNVSQILQVCCFTCSVFHELGDALTNAPLDINMSQKFYHKLYKSSFSWAHEPLTHASLDTTVSQKFYHILYKSGFSWTHDSLTHGPLDITVSQKFYHKYYNHKRSVFHKRGDMSTHILLL